MESGESNFEIRCRLCLKKSQICYSIFDEDICDTLEKLTSIKFTEDDALPSTCCSDCLEDVHRVNLLRTRIIESDKFLRNKFLNSILDQNSLRQMNSIKRANSEEDKKIFPHPGFTSGQSIDEDSERESNDSVATLDDQNSLQQINFINRAKSEEDKNIFTLTGCTSGQSIDCSERESNDLVMKNNDSKMSHKYSHLPIGITIDHEMNKSLRKRIEIKQQMGHNNIDGNYRCYECNTIIKYRKDFLAHLESHNLANCHVCGIQLPHLQTKNVTKYIHHMEIHYPQHQVCELCGVIAKNYDSLRGHKRYIHGDGAKMFKCEECNRTFNRRCRYTQHVQIVHNGERTHICEMCGKRFFTKMAVKKHIQMKHLKLRPYICEYCNKGFSSSFALRTHIRQHTNETPYICYVCGDGFRQKVSMKTHLKSKHGIIYEEENPYIYEKNKKDGDKEDS